MKLPITRKYNCSSRLTSPKGKSPYREDGIEVIIMCGILAMFSRSGPVSPAVLQRATRRLHHRGPDGQRHWISSDGLVALGHARLSIIDLTTGDQPIASEDGRKHIIVNGEF